jgi:hypothetical protein
LIGVLAELSLVSLDRASDTVALELARASQPAQRARLEESAAYRVYDRIYEDGLRFLSSATSRAAA